MGIKLTDALELGVNTGITMEYLSVSGVNVSTTYTTDGPMRQALIGISCWQTKADADAGLSPLATEVVALKDRPGNMECTNFLVANPDIYAAVLGAAYVIAKTDTRFVGEDVLEPGQTPSEVTPPE